MPQIKCDNHDCRHCDHRGDCPARRVEMIALVQIGTVCLNDTTIEEVSE